MNNDCNKIPLTTALLAAREDDRPLYDVLLQLAEQGLSAARRVLARIAQHADFESCSATLYSDATSRVAAVRRHDNRLLTLTNDATSIAGAAMNMDDMAKAEGIRHPVFAECCSLACQAATSARKLNNAWRQERERILQRHELESFRFPVAVAQVRNELRRQAAEDVTTDETEEAAAAA